MHAVGFEPTKRFALDLKSNPFDQTRVRMPNHYNDKILFLTELLMGTTHCFWRDLNPRPRAHKTRALTN